MRLKKSPSFCTLQTTPVLCLGRHTSCTCEDYGSNLACQHGLHMWDARRSLQNALQRQSELRKSRPHVSTVKMTSDPSSMTCSGCF